MGRLDGKVAVITGSTRGFGLAVARAYVREGARVVVSSRSSDAVSRAVAELGRDAAEGAVADVGEGWAAGALRDAALARFGRLDVWINNAALSGVYGPTALVPVDDTLAVLDTNIRGTYRGSVVAVRHFLAHGGGKLINVLGRGSDKPVANQNAYASSKAWSNAFTRALAKETRGSDVGVFALNPGLMLTDLVGSVRAVRGFEGRLKPFETVLRMWGDEPAVAAEEVVRLGSSATDGRTGLVVDLLGPRRLARGAWGELSRRLRGRPAAGLVLDVHTVEPES